MNTRWCITLGLLLQASVSWAASSEDESLSEIFLEGIEEASEIASNTKINIDDTPAFITILRRDQLSGLGVRTVYEAMAFVPGVELSMEASGAKQLIFRGMKEKGKVKLMVDGMVVNNLYRGSIYHYFDMPVEMIDRIEVIRGPGSVLYGSNAMSGVINIITRSAASLEEGTLFAEFGTDTTKKEGLFYKDKSSGLTYALDAYYQTREDGITAGPDRAGYTGETDEELRDYMVGAALEYDNFNLQGRYKKSRTGLFYGMSDYMDNDRSYDGNINETALLEGKYRGQIAEGYDYALTLGMSQYTQSVAGRMLPHPTEGNLIYLLDYDEHQYHGGVTLNIAALDNHNIALGTEYQYAKEDHNSLNTYFDSNPDVPYIPNAALLKPDASQRISSVFVNDEYSPLDDLDVVTGVRYDHYSDFGDALSPRVALIYRHNSRLNFKAMYSRAFRAPSWVELYINLPGASMGNENLEAETSDTYELGVVYREGLNDLLRANVYRTLVDNVIYRDATRRYIQKGSQEFYGIELEGRKSIGGNTILQAVLSWIFTEDDDGEKLHDIAPFNGNLQLSHIWGKGFSSVTSLQYVSERRREKGDTRSALDGYLSVNQSLQYQVHDWKFTATLRNLFDDDIKYPATMNTYADDYPRDGRFFSFNASWRF